MHLGRKSGWLVLLGAIFGSACISPTAPTAASATSTAASQPSARPALNCPDGITVTALNVASAPWLGQLIFYVAATVPALALSWLSWRAFEAPILSLKERFPY